jgi:hypothetical protein
MVTVTKHTWQSPDGKIHNQLDHILIDRLDIRSFRAADCDTAPQGSILGPLLFLLYINGLSKIVNDNAEVVLYTENTSIIITSLNPTNFTNSANKILQDINKWFTANLLSLNADKPQYICNL